MTIRIQFLGAAETVTGSRYLITTKDSRILVDCGLFQGYKKLRQRNWKGLPFSPSSLDAVVLTHAHIDHSGYIPKLCNLGFNGKIYCTDGTSDLLQILLPDCGHIQEEDARRANRYGYTRHEPALPLFTREDAKNSLNFLNPHPYYKEFSIAPNITARFSRAGHIVGSACLKLKVNERTITFTGDVGRPSDPIMLPADKLDSSDYLVTESTYGDRRHPSQEIAEELAKVVRDTAERGGTILIPAFAVGRAQHILHLLAVLKKEKRIPNLPVFLDSPMAINATKIYQRNKIEHRLTQKECELMCGGATYSITPSDSKSIDKMPGSKIVISASGMATGGRILHHLRHFLPERRNTVLFAGYQAGGTRGRSLVDGTDEVKIHGQYVPVQARVTQIGGLSAHADYREMLDWFKKSSINPTRVFVTHGEPAAADSFRRRISDELHWDVVVPQEGTEWSLD